MGKEEDIQKILEVQQIMDAQAAQQEQVPRGGEFAPQEEKEGYGIIDHAVELMDYPGGLARTALAAPMGAEVATSAEADQAINPFDREMAPSTAEYMERAGVGQMGQLSNAPGMRSVFEDPSKGGPDTWWPNKGGMMDITGRGALGFAGDIASDPTTYATLGVLPALKYGAKGMQALAAMGATSGKKALTKVSTSGAKNIGKRIGGATLEYGVGGPALVADTLANKPVSGSLTGIGRTIYKTAFKKADQMAEGMGKKEKYAPSEVAYKYGIIGTPEAIRKQAAKKVEELGGDYNSLMNAAEEASKTNPAAKFDINKALGMSARKVRQALDNPNLDPSTREVYNSVAKRIRDLQKASSEVLPGSKDVEFMTNRLGKGYPGTPGGARIKVKGQEYIPGKPAADLRTGKGYKDNLAANVDWKNPKQKNLENNLLRDMSNGIREEMIRAVEAGTGQGARYEEIGREMGSLLTAAPTLINESNKYGGKAFASQVDAMSLWIDPKLLVAKTAARVGAGTAFGSAVGGAARAIGEGVQKARLDQPLKRMMIDQGRPNYVERDPQALSSAWQNVNNRK
jgi:hypothetical protein